MREIATMDLSENIMAKERIDSVLAGMKTQRDNFDMILGEAAASTADMASTVGQLISGIQFQDRTKQHIAQVIETLAVLSDSAAAVASATDAAYPDMAGNGDIDRAALGRIIEKQTLGGMRGRILTRLLGEADAPDAPAEGGGGDIELF